MNHENYTGRRVSPGDVSRLQSYFNQLDEKTRSVFAPHPLTDAEAIRVCTGNDIHSHYYIITPPDEDRFIAYAAVTSHFSVNDVNRLQEAGLTLSLEHDCCFAPSIHPAFQGKGIGKILLALIITDLQKRSKRRLFLWGGVQADNTRAISFYKTAGFHTISSFHRGNQLNFNMVLDLAQQDQRDSNYQILFQK